MLGFIIPLIQLIFIGLHYIVLKGPSHLLLSSFIIGVSMTLALVNMIFFMSTHKKKQVRIFHEDHSREDKMIEKIEEATDNTNFHATMNKKLRNDKEHDELSYKAFINLYFSCFKGQGQQIALIVVNWSAPLMLALYLLYPLLGIDLYGDSTLLVMFSALLVSLFSLVTYFYALYLKTKVEAQIIEAFVHRHKKDIF